MESTVIFEGDMFKLTADNYSYWKPMMEDHLIYNDLHEHITTMEKPGGKSDKAWELLNRKTVAVIRSCWAFSTIAAVEGINKIVSGDLIPLSEQELVDCDTSYNEGCNGGLMDYAFEFIINNGSIDSEDDYPYKATDGKCDQYKVVTIDRYEDVLVNDEKSLQKAMANQPISVAIEAGGRSFQFYQSGVFSGTCGTTLDHRVAAVGYGSDENGTDYWIVRNSWGSSWGENGYISMERNLVSSCNGKCGIAMEASYPIKKGQNPPNPGPSPPSPVQPPAVCDKYFSCLESNTCCCIYEYGKYCFAWGCCHVTSKFLVQQFVTSTLLGDVVQRVWKVSPVQPPAVCDK